MHEEKKIPTKITAVFVLRFQCEITLKYQFSSEILLMFAGE